METRIFIVVQNLKIGGFQRVALDEAYGLASQSIFVTVITLEDCFTEKINNFVYKEKNFIDSYKLNIRVAEGKRIKQFVFFKTLLKSTGYKNEIISHSLRATVLIFLIRLVYKTDVHIHTVIHQLPSLSSSFQRIKRFIYSSMSDNLFAFSIAAKKDWDEKIQSSFWLKHLFRRKQIKLLRNGVFLDRLPKRISFSAQKNAQNLRLVFLGRPIKWKGSETIFKLLQMDQLSEAKGLFFFPYENKELLSNLPVTVRSRIKIIIGKSIKDYSPQKGDVHLYPANYGNKAKFIESISINCLEMAAIGIPSCVTIGGLETWPEFLHNSLINEVDWDDLHKTADTIAQLHKSNLSDVDLIKVRKLVTIENHIQQLLEYTSLTKA
jgi:hypothetical protein